MRARSIWLCAAVCLAGVLMCSASSQMGTWKLDAAKSKFAAGARRNTTVVYASQGDQVKVTTDGANADGTPSHTEWIGQFDGKDYPVTGDARADTRAYTQMNANTLQFTSKKSGKVMGTGRVVISPDGKTRTVTTTDMTPNGQTSVSTVVYEKQ